MRACAWVLKAVMRDLDLDLGVSEPQKGLELGLTRWIHTQFRPGIVPSRCAHKRSPCVKASRCHRP